MKKNLPSISTSRKRRSKVCQLWGHGGTTGRIVVPEMPGTTLEISIRHWQPSGQPLLETGPHRQDNGKDVEDSQIHGIRKNRCTCRWKCLGERSSTAMQTDMWMTHMESGISLWVSDAKAVRVQVRSTGVVPFRPESSSTRLDRGGQQHNSTSTAEIVKSAKVL